MWENFQLQENRVFLLLDETEYYRNRLEMNLTTKMFEIPYSGHF